MLAKPLHQVVSLVVSLESKTVKEKKRKERTYNLPSLNRRTTLSRSRRSAGSHGLPASAVATTTTTTVPGPGSGSAADLRAEDGVAVACHCYVALGVCSLNRVVVREFVRGLPVSSGLKWLDVLLVRCLLSVL